MKTIPGKPHFNNSVSFPAKYGQGTENSGGRINTTTMGVYKNYCKSIYYLETRLQEVLQGQMWAEGPLDTWGTHDENGQTVMAEYFRAKILS